MTTTTTTIRATAYACMRWIFAGVALSIAASATAQRIPEVGRPVCVSAFCGPSSRHPNMQIPCDSNGCECDDSCGSSGRSSGRSSGGSSSGGMLTAAVVGAAKVAFTLLAPGHAVEAFSKTSRPAAVAQAEATQRWRDTESNRTARAQRGRSLAEEDAALRQFQRAVRQKEESPHRYLRPLFQATPLGPPMNVRDPLAQLQCVREAMASAAAAVSNGVAGDISFLDARRAVDIAAGAWDSGRAPVGCAAEATPSGPMARVAQMAPAERQRLIVDMESQLASMLDAQAELDAARAKLAAEKERVDAERRRQQAEQEQKMRAAQQAAEAAQREAQAMQQALDAQHQVEPPPAMLSAPPTKTSRRHGAKKPDPPPEPPPSAAPDAAANDLLQRMLRAKAQADAQVEETRRALQQTQQEIDTAAQRYEQRAAAQRQALQDRVREAEAKQAQGVNALNRNLGRIGLSPTPATEPAVEPPAAGSAPGGQP